MKKAFPGAVVAYLAGLPVTQGAHVGEPFTVLPWERRFVRGAFARGVRSAALSIARGNGKTALAAGIASATLDGPLVVPRGETVIVASSFEQARIAFEHVAAFMGERIGDRKEWRCWDTAQQARLEHRQLGYRVRCLGSDPKRAHGLAPVLVLADEPAQWPSGTGERMRAALKTSLGKIPGSRFIALGTRPADPDHWFARMLDGGADYAQSHAAAADDPPWRRRTWRKADPFTCRWTVRERRLARCCARRCGAGAGRSRSRPDRYRDGELREALVAVDFPAAGLVFRGQGWRDGAEDVRRFQRAAADGHVRPRRSLLLRLALGAARLAVDVARQRETREGQRGRPARTRPRRMRRRPQSWPWQRACGGTRALCLAGAIEARHES